MPFCTQCGNKVSTSDIFCAKCGTRQSAAVPPSQAAAKAFLDDLSPRAASMLCYIPMVGWLAAIFVLAAPKFQHDRTVRFHAFQGLYLFVVWLIVDWVLAPIVGFAPGSGFHEAKAIRALLHLSVFAAWIWMIIKTSQEQLYRLPIVGELADRSVSEQR